MKAACLFFVAWPSLVLPHTRVIQHQQHDVLALSSVPLLMTLLMLGRCRMSIVLSLWISVATVTICRRLFLVCWKQSPHGVGVC